MGALKIVILVCGGGLLGLFLTNDVGARFDANAVETCVYLAAYGLPTIMGLIGLLKPPFRAWQASVSLLGFGVAVVRSKLWKQFDDFLDFEPRFKIWMVLLVVGVIVSAIAVAKPDDKA